LSIVKERGFVMDKKKVLIIYHKIGYGGANKMLTFLANRLVKGNFDVSVYTYASNEEPTYKLHDKITLIKENRVSHNYLFRRFIELFKVVKMIHRQKPDVVISFLTNSNVFSIIGTRFTKIPVIISERGDPRAEKGLLAKIKQSFFSLAEGAVFQTEGAKNFFPNKLQNRSTIIPNPVLMPDIKIQKWEDRKNEIYFVARFDIKQKRQDIMIKAFAKIAARYPDMILVFYGDGDDIDRINELVVNYNLKGRVVFKGKVNNIIDQISTSKIFVLTSDFEGIPNALIEAMSLGLPCVSTDCEPGGARLLIKNGINGILVPKADIDAIANSIAFFIENSEIADKLGNKAKDICNDFSPENIEKAWVKYIEKIINVWPS